MRFILHGSPHSPADMALTATSLSPHDRMRSCSRLVLHFMKSESALAAALKGP
jgi:hypothetical protein